MDEVATQAIAEHDLAGIEEWLVQGNVHCQAPDRDDADLQR